jgi:hypothetical protein
MSSSFYSGTGQSPQDVADIESLKQEAQTAADEASASATSAEQSSTSAASSAASASSTYNDFRGIYLGSLSSDPSVDANGDSVNAGDLYHDSTTGNLKYYTGSAWTEVQEVGPTGPQGPQGIQGNIGLTGAQGEQGEQGDPGLTGATGDGFTGGSYNASTGIVTFTSNDGLGFSTSDLRGATGATGATGSAATISVGTVSTGSEGSSATVSNSGTSSAAVFDFSIPVGATGATGSQGPQGQAGSDGTGFTGGSYNASTGVVTFTSNDGLGFSTGDLRGADGADASGDLISTNNLSDLANAATARTNLDVDQAGTAVALAIALG